MSNMDQFSRIENFTRGEMSDDEQRRFEAEMVKNPVLRANYEDFLLARHAAGVLVHESVKNRMQSNKGAKATSRQMGHLRRIAAAIALIILGTLIYSNITLSDKQISSHFLIEVDEVRTRSIDLPGPYVELLTAFTREDFATAVRLYQNEHFDDGFQNPAKKIYGFSLLKTGQYSEAIQVLEELAADSHNVTRSREEFNLALAYLSNGQEDQALEILQGISSDEQNDFHANAKRTLTKIKSPLRKLVF